MYNYTVSDIQNECRQFYFIEKILTRLLNNTIFK